MTDHYPPFAVFIAASMLATAWYSAWGTRKEVPFLPGAVPGVRQGPLRRFIADLRTAFVTRSFRWLCLCVVLVCVFVGTVDALELYAYQYFWELAAGDMMALQLTFLVGLLAGVPVCERVLHRMDKRASVMASIAGALGSHLVPVALRLLDALPGNGEPGLMPILLAARLAEGVCVQHTIITIASMTADVADEQEHVTGRRREGVLFGVLFFGFKTTSGIGQLIAGAGLDVIAWPAGPEVETVADLPTGILFDFGILFGPVAAIIAVVAIGCMGRYGLSDDRHQRILRELDERRASRADPAAGAG